jgi:hypothetical protein
MRPRLALDFVLSLKTSSITEPALTDAYVKRMVSISRALVASVQFSFSIAADMQRLNSRAYRRGGLDRHYCANLDFISPLGLQKFSSKTKANKSRNLARSMGKCLCPVRCGRRCPKRPGVHHPK